MRQRDPGNEYAGHATINKTLTMLKGMFSYAVEIDQLAINPIHGVPELPIESTRRIDAWPMGVIVAVAMAAAPVARSPARVSSGHSRLRGQASATRPGRVPLLAGSRDLLATWRDVGASDEIVFPNHQGDDYVRASHLDNKVWNRARMTAGTVQIDGRAYDATSMTFHELRHTFISLCLSAGRDLWEVAHWAAMTPT